MNPSNPPPAWAANIKSTSQLYPRTKTPTPRPSSNVTSNRTPSRPPSAPAPPSSPFQRNTSAPPATSIQPSPRPQQVNSPRPLTRPPSRPQSRPASSNTRPPPVFSPRPSSQPRLQSSSTYNPTEHENYKRELAQISAQLKALSKKVDNASSAEKGTVVSEVKKQKIVLSQRYSQITDAIKMQQSLKDMPTITLAPGTPSPRERTEQSRRPLNEPAPTQQPVQRPRRTQKQIATLLLQTQQESTRIMAQALLRTTTRLESDRILDAARAQHRRIGWVCIAANTPAANIIERANNRVRLMEGDCEGEYELVMEEARERVRLLEWELELEVERLRGGGGVQGRDFGVGGGLGRGLDPRLEREKGRFAVPRAVLCDCEECMARERVWNRRDFGWRCGGARCRGY